MSDVLVVYWHPTTVSMRPAIEHHLRALEKYASRGPVHYLNSYEASMPERPLVLQAVVLHTTFLTQRWGDFFGLFKQRFEWIRDLDCTKIAIPQDEYDHPEVLDEWLYELGVEVVFTNFDASERRPLYPILRDRVRFVECLTGYIDPAAVEQIRARGVTPLPARPNDVVYRASNLPYWFGRHGQTKAAIGEAAADACQRLGLTCDISTSYADVITGDAWFDFLASGRAVVGTESGSSAVDRRGEVQTAMRTILAAEPDLGFEEVARRIPGDWDRHRLTAISPRHFEAVVTSTVQVLVRGRYSGVLEADAHYVPVEPDLSNLDHALLRALDPDEGARITQRALEDVYESGRYTYARFASRIAAEAYASDRRARTPKPSGDDPVNAAHPPPSRGEFAPSAPTPAGSRGVRPVMRPNVGRALGLFHAIGRIPDRLARVRFRIRLARSIVHVLATRHALRVAVRRSWQLQPSMRPLMRDLVRFAVLAVHVDAGERRWWPRIEIRGDELAVVSMPERTEHAQTSDPPPIASRVVWDHSRVGTSVEFFAGDPAAGVLELSPTGTYEFVSLSPLAARQSSVVHLALRSLLDEKP